MKKLIGQLLKFGVVGGLAFVIDYGLLIVLTEIGGFNYLISSGCSFTVSVVFNYILSIIWVFDVDRSKQQPGKNFIVFLALSIVGLALNQILMWLQVEQLGLHYLLAKIFSTLLVMIYNFITRKVFLEQH